MKAFPQDYVPTGNKITISKMFLNLSSIRQLQCCSNVGWEACKFGAVSKTCYMVTLRTQYDIRWDTAGQDDFEAMRPMSYDGADIFLIFFAVDNPVSFQNVKHKVRQLNVIMLITLT